MDTTAKISDFSQSRAHLSDRLSDPSLRRTTEIEEVSKDKRFPVIWAVRSIGVWQGTDEEYSLLPKADAGKPHVYTSFGRPAWHTICVENDQSRISHPIHEEPEQKAQRERKDEFGTELSLGLAKFKLMGNTTVLSQRAAVALFSCILSLTVAPQSQLASSLVSSHLQLCVGVADRDVLLVNVAEPFLALAAWRCLMDPQTMALALEYLNRSATALEINVGANGEVAAQLLILLACNRAAGTELRTTLPQVPVIDFLKKLLGDSYEEINKKANFESKFGQSTMCLVQFSRFYTLPPSSFLSTLYAAGNGCVNPGCTPGVDALTPIASASLSPGDMWWIAWQFKNLLEPCELGSICLNDMGPHVLFPGEKNILHEHRCVLNIVIDCGPTRDGKPIVNYYAPRTMELRSKAKSPIEQVALTIRGLRPSHLDKALEPLDAPFESLVQHLSDPIANFKFDERDACFDMIRCAYPGMPSWQSVFEKRNIPASKYSNFVTKQKVAGAAEKIVASQLPDFAKHLQAASDKFRVHRRPLTDFTINECRAIVDALIRNNLVKDVNPISKQATHLKSTERLSEAMSKLPNGEIPWDDLLSEIKSKRAAPQPQGGFAVRLRVVVPHGKVGAAVG
jgi:hypothetical protein